MKAQGHGNTSKKTWHMQAPGQPDLCVGHVISVIGSSSLAEALSGNTEDGEDGRLLPSGAGSDYLV